MDQSQGSLNGVGFTVSGGAGPFYEVLTNRNVNDPGHAFAPLFNVDVLSYGAGSALSITFDSAINGLLLYADSWRGGFNANLDDPAVTYTFSESFNVLSGFSFSTVAGDTIEIDDDDVTFEDGVLRFIAPITTLRITSDALIQSGQILTFGVEVEEVPAPGALVLMATALLGGQLMRRKRKI